MAAPILFARTAQLGSAGPTHSLGSIPQTAQHLLFRVRARADDVTTANAYLGLRLNGSAEADSYDGNTMRFTTGASGQADDGIDLEQFILGDVTHSDVSPASIRNEHWGIIPDYVESEAHVLMQMGFSRFDALDTNAANYGTNLGAGQWNPASAVPVTSLEIHCEGGNLAAGAEITVWGLAGAGDVLTVARSAMGSTVIDFDGDVFRDFTAAAGANNFSAINPQLGKTIYVRITGGDGSTTIGFPTGTEVLENTYVAGSTAWLTLLCTDESGPQYIANLKDVL